MTLKQRANRLKMKMAAIFLAMKKKETPWYAKVSASITILYALSPIDLIPDFIPVLGYLDDVIILPALIALSLRLIPKSILSQCEEEAVHLWEDGKPKRWYYAIPIIMIWLLLLGVVILLLMR